METTHRSASLNRGVTLEYISLGYNAIEAVAGIALGLAASSVALLGFGLDSVVEASSASVLLWRLHSERSGRRSSEDAERRAVRLVAVAFLALAVYVAGRATWDLAVGARPEESTAGLVLAAASLVIMPVLAARKKAAARALDSRALQADAAQTTLCTYLSAFVLLGVGANAWLGWWWADPVAALGIAGFAAREARELWSTEDLCCI